MVYASGHEPAIALALVGEPIIISLEVFLGYAGRALMTTKPTKKKKKKKPTPQTSFPASLAQFLKSPPVIYLEKENGVGQVKILSHQPPGMKFE